MAEGSTGPAEQPITFDIFGDSDFNDGTFLVETMTNKEQEEIETVVELLDNVNSKELIDFATQQTKHHHRHVNESELDRLAEKNNAQTTVYQTKWAVTVLKGKKNTYSVKIYCEKWIKCYKITIAITFKTQVSLCF